MFKTLFVTCLLACTSSSNALKYNDVRRDLSKSHSLYGAYCLKDIFDFTGLDLTFDSFYTIFNIDYYNDVRLVASYETTYSGITANRYENIEVMQIYFDGYLELNFSCDSPNSPYYNASEEFHNGYSLSSYSSTWQNMVLYFDNPLSVNEDTFTAFNSLFSGEPNAYCFYYQGFYTFDVPLRMTNKSFEVYGAVSSNGNLYNHIICGETGCTSSFTSPNGTFNNVIIENNKVAEQSFVYFSGTLIPKRAYQYMSNTGLFDYVYQPVDYDFGDMIFSVIDAPIYMLSQLFSFELFGIQFYVAFMGIVTIVLICFVLKKII